MKRKFYLVYLLFFFALAISKSFAASHEIIPVRLFGRKNIETAALMVDGKILLKLNNPAATGDSAFTRIEKASKIIDLLEKNGITIASVEPKYVNDTAVVSVGTFEILSVEPFDTLNTYMPPLLIAFTWANRLRWGFGYPLLSQGKIDEVIRKERLKGHTIEVKTNKWLNIAEIIVDNKVLMRVEEKDEVYNAYEAAQDIAGELEEGFSQGFSAKDIRPSIVKGNIYTISIGDNILTKIEKDDEVFGKNYWQVALEKANKFREAFGAKPFSIENIKSVFTDFGIASWYGKGFHGRRTSSGEKYDMNDFTAAHKTLPFGSEVLVTKLDNKKSVLVRITDRGPFVSGRIIDLSKSAAEYLGMLGQGIAKVRIDVLHIPSKKK